MGYAVGSVVGAGVGKAVGAWRETQGKKPDTGIVSQTITYSKIDIKTEEEKVKMDLPEWGVWKVDG